ncbi:MAG TPA: hypothetical protein VFX16_36925 [Pseudonocardiaceae bacterium]|nr:hypothetical protein [Pseudonocardiaceae bacterium]
MTQRHRQPTVLSILARWRWSPDPTVWTIPCRDGAGGRSTLDVRLGHGLVTLEGSSFGLVHLAPLQVGRLRGALHGAVMALDMLGGDSMDVGTDHSQPEPSVPPQARRSVLVGRQRRPSVADIVNRLDGYELSDKPSPERPRRRMADTVQVT